MAASQLQDKSGEEGWYLQGEPVITEGEEIDLPPCYTSRTIDMSNGRAHGSVIVSSSPECFPAWRRGDIQRRCNLESASIIFEARHNYRLFSYLHMDRPRKRFSSRQRIDRMELWIGRYNDSGGRSW